MIYTKKCVYCKKNINYYDLKESQLSFTLYSWNTLKYCSVDCKNHAARDRFRAKRALKYA